MSEKTVCPFCKEKISSEARKCPHCLMPIPRNPIHGGTCPICKETIDPQARRCPHCKSWVSGSRATPPKLPGPLYRINLDEVFAERDAEYSMGEVFGLEEPRVIDLTRKPSRVRSLQCETKVDWSTYNPETGEAKVMEKCYDRAGRLVFEREVGVAYA